MSKIKKLIAAFSSIVRQPSLLNLVINNNDARKYKHLQRYPQVEALPEITFEQLSSTPDMEVEMCFLDGASMPTDLALLKTLARGKKSFFEIGTWRGESVWNVAKVLDDCTTLNLSAKEMNEMGLPKKYAKLHGIVSKKNSKILHLEGNSKTFDFKGLNKKYDLIFIDGDHSYEMVRNDTQKVFEHLVHDETVVVWHDYGYSPERVRYEVFSAILDGLSKTKHANLYHVANTMCAVYIPNKLATRPFESLQTPEVLFTVQMKTHKL